MVYKVIMPKLSATMEEGLINAWLVNVGDRVEIGDPLLEIETNKITMEIEAEAEGILLKKLYDVGDTVPVQELLAIIGDSMDELDNLSIEEMNTQEDTVHEVNQVANHHHEEQIDNRNQDKEKVRRTPIARKLASEHHIDLRNIKGTGPFGRIQKIDVENYLKKRKQKSTPLAKKIAKEKSIDIHSITGSGVQGKIMKQDVLATLTEKTNETFVKKIPFKGMRKTIADNISQSFYSAPHVTLHVDVDMTEIVALRKQLIPMIESTYNLRISYNEIMMKAVAVTLKSNPQINISLINEKEIVFHSDIHIGFAVATDNGLVVPVIKDVDKKGLGTITAEAKTLIEKSRNHSLTLDDMSGSTFTISNLGMYAVDEFTPIINQPNAAILGIGRITKKPVVYNDEIVIRSISSLSLSFDHRIIDGAPAAKFLTELKETLEQPYKLLL